MPDTIPPAVVLDVRFLLSLRNVDDPLRKRLYKVSHEAARFW